MLVLSRKAGESVVVDENVTITVMEIRGASVRIGIEAPRDVEIHRKEVWVRIQAEGKEES